MKLQQTSTPATILVPVPISKAPMMRRFAADCIDCLIPLPFIVSVFWPWAVVCVLYGLFCDSGGASVGKRLMDLETLVTTPNSARFGTKCGPGRSFLRNVTWCASRFCYASAFLAPLGFAHDAIELLLVLFSPSGRRLGDLIAGTQVTTTQSQGGQP